MSAAFTRAERRRVSSQVQARPAPAAATGSNQGPGSAWCTSNSTMTPLTTW